MIATGPNPPFCAATIEPEVVRSVSDVDDEHASVYAVFFRQVYAHTPPAPTVWNVRE
jgi:hypothetical protein